MKPIQSNSIVQSLLQPLPETAQQTVSGGAAYLKFDGIDGEVTSSTSGGGTLIPVKVKHNA